MGTPEALRLSSPACCELRWQYNESLSFSSRGYFSAPHCPPFSPSSTSGRFCIDHEEWSIVCWRGTNASWELGRTTSSRWAVTMKSQKRSSHLQSQPRARLMLWGKALRLVCILNWNSCKKVWMQSHCRRRISCQGKLCISNLMTFQYSIIFNRMICVIFQRGEHCLEPRWCVSTACISTPFRRISTMFLRWT